jgi:hypothetical protein
MHDLLQNPKNRFPLSKKITIENDIRKYYPTSGILVCKASNDKRLGATFKLLGGVKAPNGGHNHDDAGSYSILLNGTNIAGDVGGPNYYNFTTWGEEHYKYKITNSYGHPVPIINGNIQIRNVIYNMNPTMLHVINTAFSEKIDSISYDLTRAYNVSSLLSLKRTNVFSRTPNSQSIMIKDDVRFSTLSTFEVGITSRGLWAELDKTLLSLHGTFAIGTTTINVFVSSHNPFTYIKESIFEAGVTFTRLGIVLTIPSLSESVSVTYS